MTEPPVSGATHGLSQDYCRGLAMWFATRLSANEDVRRAFPELFNNSRNNDALPAIQLSIPTTGRISSQD